MTSSLLMAHKVMINFVLLKERIVNMKYCAAWVSKNMLNAFVRQCATSISPPDKSSNVIHPSLVTAKWETPAVFCSLIPALL